MSRHTTHELAIGYGLASLTRELAASGGWIQHQSTLIDSNLPLGEGRILELTKLVNQIAQQYQSVGRKMDVLFFGFEEHFLTIFTYKETQLGLLFPKEADETLDHAPVAKKFLRMNRLRILEEVEDRSHADQDNTWPALEKKLRDLLSQFLNPMRADHIIASGTLAHPLPDHPKPRTAAKVARRIIQDVPNRKKRRLLLEEFELMLAKEGIDLTQPDQREV